MGTVQALNALLALMNAAMTAMASAAQVSRIIQKMHAEGRETMTAAELAEIKAIDDTARQTLAAAIASAAS